MPERGRSRRGAVDHDEAERDEPERDEDEQALLELAALGVTSRLEVLYQPPELLSTLLEVAELVVARAGRREEDDLPGPRRARRLGDGALERRREQERHAAYARSAASGSAASPIR